jgi:hypothetical protein
MFEFSLLNPSTWGFVALSNVKVTLPVTLEVMKEI